MVGGQRPQRHLLGRHRVGPVQHGRQPPRRRLVAREDLRVARAIAHPDRVVKVHLDAGPGGRVAGRRRARGQPGERAPEIV
jgi:hypothetical protein